MMKNNLISDEERRKKREDEQAYGFRVKTKNYSLIKIDITWAIGRHQRS